MRTATRALLLLIASVVPAVVSAQTACTSYSSTVNNKSLFNQTTYASAYAFLTNTANFAANTGCNGGNGPPTLQSISANMTGTTGNPPSGDTFTVTVTYGNQTGTCNPSSPLVQTFNATVFYSPGGCSPNRPPDMNGGCLAKQGQVTPLNFTVGWSRIPASDQKAYPTMNDLVGTVNPSPSGSTVCDGQCNASVGALVNYWHAEEPSATGLFRISGDWLTTNSGTSCTTKSASLDNTKAPQACDGYAGSINGETRCVAPVGSAASSAQSPTGVGAAGNPAAGSSGAGTIGTRQGTGAGGNAGGPSSSLDGERLPIVGGSGAGSGNGEGQEPDGECGFGNNPPCKIDESNTPSDGSTRLDQAKTDVDASKDGLLDKIEEIKNGTVAKPEWTWTFSLPSGCSLLTIPGGLGEWVGSIDVCQYQPVIHDIMSFIWILGTIWGCWTMVSAAVIRT